MKRSEAAARKGVARVSASVPYANAVRASGACCAPSTAISRGVYGGRCHDDKQGARDQSSSWRWASRSGTCCRVSGGDSSTTFVRNFQRSAACGIVNSQAPVGCSGDAKQQRVHAIAITNRSSEIAGGCCARCCPKCQETRSRSRSRHMLCAIAQLHRLNSATGTRGLSTTAVAELACGAGGGPRCPSHDEQCSHNKCCARNQLLNAQKPVSAINTYETTTQCTYVQCDWWLARQRSARRSSGIWGGQYCAVVIVIISSIVLVLGLQAVVLARCICIPSYR